MKKYCFLFSFLFILISQSVCALILPDKTDALVKDVVEKDGKIIKATLIDPTFINSPVGKLKFKNVITFYENGRVKEGELEQQIVATPIGRLKLEGKISFYENGKIKEIYISGPQNAILPVGNMSVEGIAIFYDNGNVDRVDLSTSQVITTSIGKLKMDGTLYFYPSRKFLGAYLAEHQMIKTPIGNIKVKYVSFYESGKLKSIQTSEVTDFVSQIGGFKIVGASFYESSKILSIQIIPQNINIDGIFNAKEILFYESGKINKVLLEKVKPYEFEGKIINITALYLDEAGNKIGFDISPVLIKTSFGDFNVKTIYVYENGKVKSFDLAEPITLNNVKNVVRVLFYENGSLYGIFTSLPIDYQSPVGNFLVKGFYFDKSDSTRIVGIEFEKPTFVKTPIGNVKMYSLFYKDKTVIGGSIEEKIINAFKNRFSVNYINFSENGKIKSVTLSKPQQVMLSTKFIIKDRLFLYESGKIKAVTLSEKTLIEGREFKENEIVVFSEDGKLLGNGRYNSDKNDVEL